MDYIMRDYRRESPHLNSSVNSTATKPVLKARNLSREKLIKTLHVEFEEIKKRINEVEHSNEYVRTILHGQGFKKGKQRNKEAYEARSIVHYENQQDQSQVVQRTSQREESEAEFKGAIRKNSQVKKNQPQVPTSFHQSIEFQKTEEPIYERDHFEMSNQSNTKSNGNLLYRHTLPPNGYIYSPQDYTAPVQSFPISQFNSINPYPVSVQYAPYPPAFNQSLSIYQQKSNKFQEMYKQQVQKVKILEQTLEEREQDAVALRRLQKKYNSIASEYTDAMESHLEQFFDSVIKKRLSEIGKCVKKNENKLKKLQMRIKDKEEDKRSRRIISQHREKRSQSRSKNSRSPREYLTVLNPPQRLSSKRSTYEPSLHNEYRSKQSETSRPNQHFEEIAVQYQDIIKTKTKECEQSQQRLREKERELLQMASKCAKLQLKISDLTDIPKAARNRKYSEKEENLLANLVFDNEPDILALNRKISELEGIISSKQKELSYKDAAIGQCNRKLSDLTNKMKKSDAQILKLRQQSKRMDNDQKTQQSLQKTIKKLQSDLFSKQAEYSQLKQKCSKFENDKIKKDCENITLTNKIKKLQGEVLLKEEKMKELEKIILSNVGSDQNDLDKSVYLEKYDQKELQSLQDDKEKLEEQLLKQRESLFALQKENEHLREKYMEMGNNNDQLRKEIESLQIHNESMRITLKAQEFEKYKVDPPSSPLQKLLLQGDCLSEDEEESLTRSQLEDVKKKLEQAQNSLKIQNQKTFQENRKVLKLTSEANYLREQLSDRQSKYEKLRKQHEEAKYQISLLEQAIQVKDSDLEVQRKINAQRIQEIENQWHEFQQDVKNKYDQRLDGSHNSQEMSQLKNSHLRSQSSFVNYKVTYSQAHLENEKLLERIKQADKIIEVQKEMEDRIVNEYRLNVERIKGELREKCKENERFCEEIQNLKRKVRVLESSEPRQKKAQQEKSLMEESSTQKMIELQMQINDMREISSKREEVQQQLYHQIYEKEKQLQDMAVKLTAKERRIQQLQDLLQLKEMNISSHISTSQLKPRMRDSMQSHNSLRYSMLSNFTNKDKTIELDLSQVGQSVYDHNQSMISNVSEVFAREEFPYEKMQLKRIEQRRLFEKTAAYIKSLKKAIDQKNKRIKLLQKKIESLRNSQLVRKDIYQLKCDYNDFQPDASDLFKDYSSVQLESTHSKRYRMKQLEHETKLTIEQNNLLNNQIESMQEELLKAEEQEDSLMKLKDLYKEEIKNLIKQNQEQAKMFEEEVKKERTKIEQSESIQTMEALKQIFLKIVRGFMALQGEGSKVRKREEKRKQLEDFLKVCLNLFNFDSQTREKLLAEFKQGKR